MSKIIVVANQRGGVAKTTTCQVLSACFRKKGLKVLNIDADPQGDTSFGMNAVDENTLYEVMKNKINARNAIQNTEQGEIIPSSILLSNADLEFSNTGREYILKNALEDIQNDYDYIIIDTPPSLGIMTTNALTCANQLLIPVGADIYSLKGMDALHDTVDIVKQYCNPNLEIIGILIIKYSSRPKANRGMKQAIESLCTEWDCEPFKNQISESVVVKEAQIKQISLLDYAPNSKPAIDYIAVADEILAINTIHKI